MVGANFTGAELLEVDFTAAVFTDVHSRGLKSERAVATMVR